MACPSAVVPKGWWTDGLSHQEAPQADGEEEAPQAAEEDPDPAQEQEVSSAGAAVFAGAPAACPRLPPRPAGGTGSCRCHPLRAPWVRLLPFCRHHSGNTTVTVARLPDNG